VAFANGKHKDIVANDATYHSKWFLVKFFANVFIIKNVEKNLKNVKSAQKTS